MCKFIRTMHILIVLHVSDISIHSKLIKIVFNVFLFLFFSHWKRLVGNRIETGTILKTQFKISSKKWERKWQKIGLMRSRVKLPSMICIRRWCNASERLHAGRLSLLTENWLRGHFLTFHQLLDTLPAVLK